MKMSVHHHESINGGVETGGKLVISDVGFWCNLCSGDNSVSETHQALALV